MACPICPNCEGGWPSKRSPSVRTVLTQEGEGGMYKAEKRLYTTADGSEVVDENDPRAAVLLAAEGMEIPDAQAERLGLTGRKRAAAPEPMAVPSIAADPPQEEAPADEAPAAKSVSGPPENKARAASTRKADESK